MRFLFVALVVLGLLVACSSPQSVPSSVVAPQDSVVSPAPANPAPVETVAVSAPQSTPVATPAPTLQPEPVTAPVTVEPSEVKIAISGFKFVPATVTVKAGTKVTWTNEDGTPHTVESGDGTLRSDELSKGDSYSVTLSKPGNISYICGIHQSMKGAVVVE